jgi:glycosyltransferase involved in cell wall biosynthesis
MSHRTQMAMVVFSYYPADPRVRREAEALFEAGMGVNVICLKDGPQPRKEIVNGVEVYRLPIQRKRAGKLRYLWEYTYFTLSAFFALTLLHIRKHYSIVHVHNMPDILVFSSLIPRLCGSKVILDLHDPMPEVYMAKYSINTPHPWIRLLLSLEKCSIGFSSLVLTPNIAFRDLFISRGCPKQKIHVVMNSPDEKIFHGDKNTTPSERLPLDQDGFVVMYHGTIVERYGLDIALHAVNLVRDKIPNLVFHVYGDGDYVTSFLNLVAQLNLSDIVKYHGHVSLETISAVIRHINVGLIPNKTSPFTDINMPTRIFEYLSKEKPVIASRTEGILDYFDEESLLFFQPGSAEGLGQMILDVYTNSERCRAILKRGISIYHAHRWEFQRQHFLKLVGSLLKDDFLQ